MRREILAIVGCVLALDAVYLAEAVRYPVGTPSRPGAAFYPLLVGALVAISAVATALEEGRRGPAPAVTWPDRPALRRVIALLGAALSYVVLLPYTGHILASVPVTVISLRVMGLRSWPLLGAVTALLILGSYYHFGVLLMVPFPPGILGG